MKSDPVPAPKKEAEPTKEVDAAEKEKIEKKKAEIKEMEQ